MNKSSYLFTWLNAEESAVISGGGSPNFVFSSEDPTMEGKITNVDGKGKELIVSKPTEDTSNSIVGTINSPYLELSLPAPIISL